MMLVGEPRWMLELLVGVGFVFLIGCFFGGLGCFLVGFWCFLGLFFFFNTCMHPLKLWHWDSMQWLPSSKIQGPSGNFFQENKQTNKKKVQVSVFFYYYYFICMINATLSCFLSWDIPVFFHEVVMSLQDLKSLESKTNILN